MFWFSGVFKTPLVIVIIGFLQGHAGPAHLHALGAWAPAPRGLDRLEVKRYGDISDMGNR